MRALIFALLLPLAAPPALAQESQVPAPGTDVERTALHPGETISVTLAPGKTHQLLRHATAHTPGAITIAYQVAGGRSVVVATSRTGYDSSFTILADPDGSGAFRPEGELALPGNGATVTKTFAGSLGTINVGDFSGGPQGSQTHPPAGQ